MTVQNQATQYRAFTKKTLDHSSENGFSFSFFCDCCGKEWVSPVRSFSGRSWAVEHKAAFDIANAEAKLYFNNCPECGDWVCDDCFLPETEICVKCEKSEQPMHVVA